MASPTALRSAGKEGREASKTDRPRVSPYDGIAALEHLSPAWYDGYDAMEKVKQRELVDQMAREGQELGWE